jgi:hypothetical protein
MERRGRSIRGGEKLRLAEGLVRFCPSVCKV